MLICNVLLPQASLSALLIKTLQLLLWKQNALDKDEDCDEIVA